ncbi:hypothetical protein [Aeromonas sp. QDB12]
MAYTLGSQTDATYRRLLAVR